jgi:SAM-dependent methyltransferase
MNAICPNCGWHIDIDEKPEIHCKSCSVKYPVLFGVPVLIPGATIKKNKYPDFERGEAISKQIAWGQKKEEISDCLSHHVIMPDRNIQIESDQFCNRLKASGAEIALSISEKNNESLSFNQPEMIKLIFEPLILPKAFKIGTTTSINLKIENLSSCKLTSEGENPFHISYFWRPKKNNSFLSLSSFFQKSTEIEGLRTKLLINLAPGQKLTQPIRLETPKVSGNYILDIIPLIEGITWLNESSVTTDVVVNKTTTEIVYKHRLEGPCLSYNEKNDKAVEKFVHWMQRFCKKEKPFILEIGGNIYPSTMKTNFDKQSIINLDVDFHGLAVRSIVIDDGIKSVIADGSNVPFQDSSFDAIVMFAAFHHFLDPIGLLKHLAKKLKNDGIICLLCEPIGHVFPEYNNSDFIAELKNGVYEQSFEIWEYVELIEAANLCIRDAIFDRGSAMIVIGPP